MFATNGSFFHPLDIDKTDVLPKAFTFPFYYQPHALTIKASKELQNYLLSQTNFKHNFGLDASKSGLKIGKMFGVMIVKNTPLKNFFKSSWDKNKLAKSKDVVYNKEEMKIMSIPSLHFNQLNHNFTLKIMDTKRVSTLKSLTPKRMSIEITDNNKEL